MITVDGSSIPWAFDERRGAPPGHLRGKHAFCVAEGPALDRAQLAFGREGQGGLCLKVFFIPLGDEGIEGYYWGRANRGRSTKEVEGRGEISRLVEATVAQNLCWAGGLAPRAYGLLLVDRGGRMFPAQLTDHCPTPLAKDEELPRLKRGVVDWCREFGVAPARMGMLGVRDFRAGRLIDFQGFRLTNETIGRVVDYVREQGRYGKHHYQSIPEVGLGAKPRDTDRRIEEMGLADVDFEGARVLDVGCNLGAMCHYADSRGARRVVGVDLEPQIHAARVLAAYLQRWNIDFVAMDVRQEHLRERFDITLMLSMVMHVGLPEWVCEVTDRLMILEENARGSRFDTNRWLAHLGERFDRVEVVGHTTDHNPDHPKPVIFAWRDR